MLDERLARVLGLELADPARIPELAGDAQVLAAPDERVGAAPLRGGGDAVGGEVVLFAAGDGDQSCRSCDVSLEPFLGRREGDLFLDM